MPDKASLMFVPLAGAESLPMKLPSQKWLMDLFQWKLDERVPVDVRALFEAAKGMIAYGYFYYPLFKLASDQMMRTAEAAVSMKCEMLQAPRSAKTFEKRLGWLRESGVLTPDQWKDWQPFRTLHNEGSHPKFQGQVPPFFPIKVIPKAVRAINDLFCRDEIVHK